MSVLHQACCTARSGGVRNLDTEISPAGQAAVETISPAEYVRGPTKMLVPHVIGGG